MREKKKQKGLENILHDQAIVTPEYNADDYPRRKKKLGRPNDPPKLPPTSKGLARAVKTRGGPPGKTTVFVRRYNLKSRVSPPP